MKSVCALICFSCISISRQFRTTQIHKDIIYRRSNLFEAGFIDRPANKFPIEMESKDLEVVHGYHQSLKKALSAKSDEAVLDILRACLNTTASVAILRETDIGKTLQSIKKDSTDEKVIKEVKLLIAKWKKDCSNARPVDDATASDNNQSRPNRTKQTTKFYNAEEEERASKPTNPKMLHVTVEAKKQPIPKRRTDGTLEFPEYPHFRPNLTPKEVLQMGSFGGTYYRSITSGVTGETYHKQWEEFPADWFGKLNIAKCISSKNYDNAINTYKVSCGGDLHMWESSGWITHIDPYGWFQWYCRFYLGRRCSDDERQIGRALGVIGPKGRWRRNLMNKCLASGKRPEVSANDPAIAPKVRQLLQVC